MKKKPTFPWLGSALLIGTSAYIAYRYSYGPWLRRWGAHPDEVNASMPGDDLVPDALFSSTRALTIHASPEQIWPWLAQMGQGKGGLYSYDFLENLMGLEIHSARQILPEYQAIQAGDVVALEPSGSGYTVQEVAPGSYLLLYTAGSDDTEMGRVFKANGIKSTWLFYLNGTDNGCTRLIVRWRAVIDKYSSMYARLMSIGLEPIEFLMERKMMLGIKQRVERPSSQECCDCCCSEVE
jgi:hypothetical protein